MSVIQLDPRSGRGDNDSRHEYLDISAGPWWRKPEYPEETTDLQQVTDETFTHMATTPYYNILYADWLTPTCKFTSVNKTFLKTVYAEEICLILVDRSITRTGRSLTKNQVGDQLLALGTTHTGD